jgi:hypothetical protein
MKEKKKKKKKIVVKSATFQLEAGAVNTKGEICPLARMPLDMPVN